MTKFKEIRDRLGLDSHVGKAKCKKCGKENNLTSGECVTICKERYEELLDYERVALWVLDLIRFFA